MKSTDIKNLYEDDTYYLGGISKFTGKMVGVEGFLEFAAGSIQQKKIDRCNLLDFKNKTVLDVGFGRGEGLKYCAENGAKKVIGIDYSSAAFKIAADYMKGVKTEYKLYNIDIEHIDKIEEDDIEIIYMIDILEHVSDEEIITFLNKIKPKLNKNCKLLAFTPKDHFGDYMGMHFNYNTENNLKEIFKIIFEKVEIKIYKMKKELFYIFCEDLK